MPSSLTGHWRLRQDLSSSQKELLQCMGRKVWEISCIDKADEDFNLIHFKRVTPDGKDMHFFEKYVVIYLDSRVLRTLSLLVKSLEFDKVRYTHKLVANGVEKKFDDDEKRFGPCSSRTSWEENHDGKTGFTIRWYIKRGVLKVFHYVNEKDELQVELEMTLANGTVSRSTKVYSRLPFDDTMRAKINESPFRDNIVW